MSERQWGTVPEHCSADGDAWSYFTHDQARSRAYRWGEDGIAGVSDDKQRLCFALALWNGRAPILKERMFGLTNSEGNQGEGRRVRPPVFLACRPPEPVDEPARDFHHRLLRAAAAVRRGEWRPLTPTGRPDNDSCRNLPAWTWTHPDARHLVVANHCDRPAQARLPLPWDDLRGPDRRLTDLLTAQTCDRAGDELADPGLFVALEAWQEHVFEVG